MDLKPVWKQHYAVAPAQLANVQRQEKKRGEVQKEEEVRDRREEERPPQEWLGHERTPALPSCPKRHKAMQSPRSLNRFTGFHPWDRGRPVRWLRAGEPGRVARGPSTAQQDVVWLTA